MMLFCYLMYFLFGNSAKIVVDGNLFAKAYVAALLLRAAANQELEIVVVNPFTGEEIVTFSCKRQQNAFIVFRLCCNANKCHLLGGFRRAEHNLNGVVAVGGSENLLICIILHFRHSYLNYC